MFDFVTRATHVHNGSLDSKQVLIFSISCLQNLLMLDRLVEQNVCFYSPVDLELLDG